MSGNNPMTRLSLLLAFDRAQRAGLHHFAAALVKLYRKEYPAK